jgi:hypothetical protein
MPTDDQSDVIDLNAELDRLLALDPIEYVRQRVSAAEQGNTVAAADAEPWPEPVDGGELLAEIAQAHRDHIVLTPEQSDTIALWAVYTHGCRLKRLVRRPYPFRSQRNRSTLVLHKIGCAQQRCHRHLRDTALFTDRR